MKNNNNDMNVEEEKVYIVEAILDSKKFKGQIHYLVKWENFPQEQNTWEPVSHLEDCQDLVNEFEAKKLRTKIKEKREMSP